MLKEIQSALLELGFEANEHTMLAYWDSDLVCRFANNAYIDWFGKTPDEIINKVTMPDLLGDLYEKNIKYIDGVLGGKVQVFERDVPIANGSVRNSVATYIPDYDDGVVRGFYAHVTDITFLKNKNTSGWSSIHTKNAWFFEEKIIGSVEKYLQANILNEFPGIPMLAKRFFISESKLKRDFKSRYKTTVFSYFRNLQMEFAEAYIIEKKCSKKQMAALLHFENPSNFLACYKKYLFEKTDRTIAEEIQKNTDYNYKTFIEQSPFAIAMLDTRLILIAASKKWAETYRLEYNHQIGLNIYAISPYMESKWKAIFEGGLQGKSYNDENKFVNEDGTMRWVRWDVHPWYKNNGTVGGLLLFSENITELKQHEEENRKLLEIFNKTSEIAHIGAWKRNFKEGTTLWSNVLKEILEVGSDYVPEYNEGINFYKAGKSRRKIERALINATELGLSFDIEVEIITAKGTQKRVRVIGYPDIIDGYCEKLMGIMQEVAVKHDNTLIETDKRQPLKG